LIGPDSTCSIATSVSVRFHAFLKSSIANALAPVMREAGLAVQESEPHMSAYFDQAQVIQTTQTESQEDMGMLPGTESRADLLFKSEDGAKVVLVDVTSTSGISKHAKLHQYAGGSGGNG
jgi:hypothetical protein